MDDNLLRYIADDAALNQLVSGLPLIALLGIMAVCILLLSRGADWMIDGVVALALRTGLPKIVIGATVVSLGTTTPEAFVSVFAAFTGNPRLALGNGVGSIIADTGLIFGLTAVLAKVPLDRFILDRTGWVQVGAATLLVLLAVVSWFLTGGEPVLSRGVGIFFLLLLAGYMYLSYFWARTRCDIDDYCEEPGEVPDLGLGKSWLLIVFGLVLVVVGARILIPCASELAMRLGVPDDVIAATLVAFGTSLPELITAIAAIRKGHPEITVGNVVGADVLNCLFVIGAAATARPLAVPDTFFYFHFPAMILILYSFRAFISMDREGYFRRWQGIWLLTLYAAYVILQFALNVEIPGSH